MPGEMYYDRLSRIETAAHGGIPDRVPVVLNINLFPARHCGVKLSEYIWGGDRALDASLRTATELNVDGVDLAGAVHPLAFVFGFGGKMRLPGRELGEDELYQFDESQPIMEVEDYDLIIQHGWKAFIPKLIERCVDFMPKQEVFSTLAKIGEETVKAIEKFRENDIVVFMGGATTSPFEMFSTARTISEFFKDLRRYPQKVIDAMKAAMPDVVESAIQTVKASGINRLFFFGARESGGLISPKMYEKFCHPFRKQMIEAFISAGIEVQLHYDGDWTKNLEYFKDFPSGKVVLHTDGATDIFKAKEILGNRIALKGDVPPAYLTLGTPEKVEVYCRRLIEEVGRGGGFILAQGCDVPINAKFENVKAMVDAAHKYGVYSQE
ncbi:MAG: uroporphyrinogen decarboxylase family protein [Moorellaceae bacterium]